MNEGTISGSALRRRAEAITWVRQQIAYWGLTYEQLEAAGCWAPRGPRSVCYRNAEGQTWDGEGDMPTWLQRAVNAGQSAAHFRVEAVGA